ncbi:MAG: NIPSNAP family protein [Alphaproteobacteria bacterium]
MTLYEKRTYQIVLGKMPEMLKHETALFEVLKAEALDSYCVGYFVSDTGPLHQLIHIWRFDDDAARRDFWARFYASEAVLKVVPNIRPLIQTQDVQLMTGAPFGPLP